MPMRRRRTAMRPTGRGPVQKRPRMVTVNTDSQLKQIVARYKKKLVVA